MTTLDLRAWTPSTTSARTAIDTAGEDYVGKHRSPGHRRDHIKARFSIARMHYVPRHLQHHLAAAA